MDILRVNFNIGYVSRMSDLAILSSSLYLRNLIAILPLLSNASGNQLSHINDPLQVASLDATTMMMSQLQDRQTHCSLSFHAWMMLPRREGGRGRARVRARAEANNLHAHSLRSSPPLMPIFPLPSFSPSLLPIPPFPSPSFLPPSLPPFAITVLASCPTLSQSVSPSSHNGMT